ncbi:terpene synthase family protein [Nocardia brasiliensis]|uniref:terpene synthase family protein n=1 Tax=Nocardia brasiliensis TaxID=37326 RepID=UPI003D797F22
MLHAAAATILDDIITNSTADESSKIIREFNQCICGQSSSLQRLDYLSDVYARMRTEFPPRLWRRYAEAITGAVRCGLDEARHSSPASEVFPDLESYLTFRRSEIFGYAMLIVFEWCLGVNLSYSRQSVPRLSEIIDVVIDYWTIINDIYSFNRENSHGEKLNILWILSDGNSSSIYEAAKIATAIASDTESRLRALISALQSEQSCGNDLKWFLENIDYMISGAIMFCKITSRYRCEG